MASFYGKADGCTFLTVYRDSGNMKLAEFETEFMFSPAIIHNAPIYAETFTIYGIPVGKETYAPIATYTRASKDDYHLLRVYEFNIKAPFELVK